MLVKIKCFISIHLGYTNLILLRNCHLIYYSTYVEYFNSHLHQKHDKVTETLRPDKDKKYVVPITQQPIKMIFGDNDKLSGFVIPMTNKTELKKTFNITKDVWITKSGSGYFIADMKEEKWIYIEL